jgi:hypothetical protein
MILPILTIGIFDDEKVLQNKIVNILKIKKQIKKKQIKQRLKIKSNLLNIDIYTNANFNQNHDYKK